MLGAGSQDFAAQDAEMGTVPGYHEKAAKRSLAAQVLGAFKVNEACEIGDPGDILRQVSGILTVLEAAHLDADALERASPGETQASMMHSSYPVFMASALDGINTLVSLAIFLGEAA